MVPTTSTGRWDLRPRPRAFGSTLTRGILAARSSHSSTIAAMVTIAREFTWRFFTPVAQSPACPVARTYSHDMRVAVLADIHGNPPGV